MSERVIGDVAEFTVISYWDPTQAEAALREIAGEGITKVWDLDVDEKFLIDKSTVQHFHVLNWDHDGHWTSASWGMFRRCRTMVATCYNDPLLSCGACRMLHGSPY
ncbi:MAG: hypothetical protein ACR2OV_12210 [Hyphomicrobiaceae bacterium]